ncbi:MAG: diguanylate cyclase [Gallionella sp.]|nr:diguanylate cyclase [Gallionella sp.]
MTSDVRIDDDGHIEKLYGDALLRASFNAMSEGMALHRLVYNALGEVIDYLILDVNPSFEMQTGLSKDAVIGKLASKAYGAKSAPFLDIYSKVALTQQSVRFEQYFPPLQKHFLINVFSPGKDQFVTIFEDITEHKHSEERWKFALEGAGDGVWDWNIQTGAAMFSKRYKEMLGFEENEIKSAASEWSDRVHPEDMPHVMEVLQEHIDGKTPSARIEFRMLCKDGSWKWMLGRGMVVSRDTDGKPLRLVGTNTDITERKQAEIQLHLTQFAMENASFGIYWLDKNAHVYYVNKKACQTLGYTKEELHNLSIPDLDPLFPMEHWESNWENLKRDKSQFFESQHRCKDGRMIPVEISANYVKLGEFEYSVAYSRDISDRKRVDEEIHHLAFYDALTNLPNRRLLNDRLAQAMVASKRSGFYCALMFLDLDNFKPLNDTHGHGAGDLLLIEAAGRLKNCIREMDTVARFGGDEFVVMLSELDVDKTEAITQTNIVAQKICAVLSEPYLLSIKHERKADATVEHHCTVSIGVAMFINHEVSQGDIMKRADATMYQAKMTGKNRILFFEEQV